MILALLLACATPEPAAPPPTAPPPVEVVDDLSGLVQGRAHRVVHVLGFADAAAAEAAAVALSSQGLHVSSAGEGEQWTVEATETLIITPANVAARREALEALAQGYGGTYEGWQGEPLP